MAKKAVNFRIDEELLAKLDRIGKEHDIENRTGVLEWMIRKASADIEVHDLLRRHWTMSLTERYGKDAPVSVLITGADKVVRGRPSFEARVRVAGEPCDLIEADVFEARTGGLEIHVINPLVDHFPGLVFDRLSDAQLADAREGTGWAESDDFMISVMRKVSELQSLPVWDAPGDRIPKTSGEVTS